MAGRVSAVSVASVTMYLSLHETRGSMCSMRVLFSHAFWVHCRDVAELAVCRRFAVTASEDGTARVWDLQVQPLPPPQRHSSRVHTVAACSDGTMAVSLGAALPPSLCSVLLTAQVCRLASRHGLPACGTCSPFCRVSVARMHAVLHIERQEGLHGYKQMSCSGCAPSRSSARAQHHKDTHSIS